MSATANCPMSWTRKAKAICARKAAASASAFMSSAATPGQSHGTPLDFGHELLNDNLERIGESLEFAFKRFPVLERAGIKKVINGPFTFAPDGNPLVGPVPGLKNFWSACAVMAGFSQGGGVGLTLAEWMVEGEPSRDVFAMDVARFGNWITPGYTRAKVKENYQRRFSVSYPNEELPAARPHQTTPAYDIWKDQRAVFGAHYGMEAVNYFAPEGEPLEETPTFRRSNAFDAVSRKNAALCAKQSASTKFTISANTMSPVPVPANGWTGSWLAAFPKPGRLSLTPMLSPKGKLIGDFTVSCFIGNRISIDCFLWHAGRAHALVHAEPA